MILCPLKGPPSHSDASAVRALATVGRETAPRHFSAKKSFLSTGAQLHAGKEKGLPITQPDLASDSNGEGEKLNCLFNPIQIQIEQGQSKLCGVNRVLLTAAFAARL